MTNDKNKFIQRIRELMASGMTHRDAAAAAVKESWDRFRQRRADSGKPKDSLQLPVELGGRDELFKR